MVYSKTSQFMLNNYINLFYTNKIKNSIIKAKSAIASVNANPKIAKRNMSSFKVGFLEVPRINDPKINPIPIPAPASPEVDNPAPIFCAACNNINKNKKKELYLYHISMVFCFSVVNTEKKGIEPINSVLKTEVLPLNYFSIAYVTN